MDELLIDYIMKQNQTSNIWSYEADSSFLKLLSKLLNHYIMNNQIEIFTELMSFSGRLWNYKFSQNSQLIQDALMIFKSLIVIKVIPIVQEVYKTILLDAQISFETILKSAVNESCLDSKANFDSKRAETSLLFDLCVFAELGKIF